MPGPATSVYLPADLRAKVTRLADAQGRSASSVIVDAVRQKLARSESAGGDTVALGHRVARMEQRLEKVIRDGAMVKESVLLFIRVWLEHNPPLDEAIEESAAASASARFERFLDYVANAIDSGRSSEFFSPPGGGDAPAQGATS
jgi:predicted transcriptional regulator